MSKTNSEDPFRHSRAEISLEVAFAILVCFGSIFGNLLVVYVINKYSEMQTITNIFIQNLALTDIFMATLTMPFWITSLYTKKWNLSQKLCEYSASVNHTLSLASILNISLIALNRYIKVVKKDLYIKFFPSRKVSCLYCGVVWLLAVLLATPPLYGWGEMKFDSDSFVCSFNWREGQFSFVILLAGFFDLTTFAIFYFYWKIYQKVKESTGNVNVNIAQNGFGVATFRRADIKVLKSLFTVVCFFLLTLGPIAISVFVTASGGYIPQEVLEVSTYLMFSSSLVNPIIYGVMNPQFKVAFKKVFSGGRCGNYNRDQREARIAAVMIAPITIETS